MYKVLEPARMAGLEVRNRFIRSATWDALADDRGAVTDRSVELYEGLAEGGVGLITTGYSFVSKHGQAAVKQYGIYSDELIPGLKRLVQASHKHGAKIVAQIVHAGISSPYFAKTGQVALAPSAIEGRQPHRALTDGEIEGIVDDFATAAVRAREAGFDGVQLHGAHGYLMSQFFSKLANRREDRWGGSPENRRRFHVETVRRVRAAVGSDFPVFIKFGIMDDGEGGTSLEEGIEALKAMIEVGLDGVEISAGIGRFSTAVSPDGKIEVIPFRERAAAAKRAVDVPVVLVNGVRSLESAEDIVTSGDADFISMARALIREPGLIKRWQSGDNIRAKCISCAKCLSNVGRGEPLECMEERRIREESRV